MIDNLSPHLRAFVAIVDAGSITAAADQLGMAKSSLSQNLKSLEEALGIRLLVRTTRRQALTEAGEKYYYYCKKMAGLADAATREMRELYSEPEGTLNITAPHAVIVPKLTSAIISLKKRYPKITPRLIVDDRRLGIIEHNIDVAISVGKLADSDFRAQKIGDSRDILCVAPACLDNAQISPDDLGDVRHLGTCPFIAHAWQQNDPHYKFFEPQSTEERRISFQSAIIANSSSAVYKLALKGAGMAVLPEFLIEQDLAAGRLIRLLAQFPTSPVPIYAVHPYQHLPPASIKFFISEVRRIFTAARKK